MVFCYNSPINQSINQSFNPGEKGEGGHWQWGWGMRGGRGGNKCQQLVGLFKGIGEYPGYYENISKSFKFYQDKK